MAESAGKRHVSSLAGDPDIGPIVPHFVARLPGQVAKLRELLAAGNALDLCELLHQMRGAGQSYGFSRMTELAAGMEEGLRAGKSVHEMRETAERLVEFIEHVEGFGE